MRARLILLFLTLLPTLSYASQHGNNSWEIALSNIANSLTGPVAYSISVIAIFISGMTMVFADLQNGGKRFVISACGISIATFAAQILTGFLGFSGALV